MTDYRGYELHPEAYGDIDELRGYIAADNPDAADRVVIEVFDAIERLVPFPHSGHVNGPLKTYFFEHLAETAGTGSAA